MSERVAIVGAGRMGLALGSALYRVHAVERLTFFGRAMEPPPHPIFDERPPPGEEPVVEYRIGITPLPSGTTILLLAVPDDALPEVAHDVAAAGPAPAGCVALHLAGALSTDVLTPLHQAGYALGSIHPLQTVADPWSGADRLIGSAYSIAGEPAAIVAARRLVNELAGHALVIPIARRAIYHAAAAVASNYLVALTAAATRLLAEAGVEEDEAMHAIIPLMRGTLDNIEQLGIRAALTGPIARGDLDTIRLHLLRLSGDDRALYCALGLETLRLARTAGLDDEKAAEIEQLLTP